MAVDILGVNGPAGAQLVGLPLKIDPGLKGKLPRVETGDDNHVGWLMWGADAAHNERLD